MLHARCFVTALLLAVFALTPCLQADETQAKQERVVPEIPVEESAAEKEPAEDGAAAEGEGDKAE